MPEAISRIPSSRKGARARPSAMCWVGEEEAKRDTWMMGMVSGLATGETRDVVSGKATLKLAQTPWSRPRRVG